MPNDGSAAGALISNLKKTRKELNPSIPIPPAQPAPQPTPPQKESRVILRRGEEFEVVTREKRRVKKNFLLSESLAIQFAAEASELGVSQNELFNQLLMQRYSNHQS